MPRTTIPAYDIIRAGLSLPAQTLADVTNHHTVPSNYGRTFLDVANTNMSLGFNVTVETPGTVDGLAIADLVVLIPAGGEKLIGPFSVGTFNQSDGSLYVNVDAGSDPYLGFRAYQLP